MYCYCGTSGCLEGFCDFSGWIASAFWKMCTLIDGIAEIQRVKISPDHDMDGHSGSLERHVVLMTAGLQPVSYLMKQHLYSTR